MVDRKECLEDLNIGDAWFRTMHFLDFKGFKQRFKFTMRQIGGYNYLWAQPIINSKFALKQLSDSIQLANTNKEMSLTKENEEKQEKECADSVNKLNKINN